MYSSKKKQLSHTPRSFLNYQCSSVSDLTWLRLSVCVCVFLNKISAQVHFSRVLKDGSHFKTGFRPSCWQSCASRVVGDGPMDGWNCRRNREGGATWNSPEWVSEISEPRLRRPSWPERPRRAQTRCPRWMHWLRTSAYTQTHTHAHK